MMRQLNLESIVILLVAYCFISMDSVFASTQLKYPTTKDSLSQLIIPLSATNRTFSIAGRDTIMKSYAESYAGFSAPVRITHSSDSAYIWFKGPGYIIGKDYSYSSLDQVLKIKPFNSDSTHQHFTYATRLFLTLGVYRTSGFFGDTVLTIELEMGKLGTPDTHTQLIRLKYGPTEDIYTTPGNTRYFWKDWDDADYSHNYTMGIPLDSAYFGWYIKEIRLRFNKDYPSAHVVPSLELFAVNLQTFIDVQAPVFFYQGDSQWGDSLLNNSITDIAEQQTVRQAGCIITSAAMAMRNLGINHDSSGNNVTPMVLLSWLRSHNGFLANTNVLNSYNKFIEFANCARTAGQNDSLTLTMEVLRTSHNPSANDSVIKVRTEDAFANQYPALLRVVKRTFPCQQDAHTILGFGLIPDFAQTVGTYGTFKILDAGRSLANQQPNLWRRQVCDTLYKGQYHYSHVFKPTRGVQILQSPLQIVLHSPGRLYIVSPQGYQIGYPDRFGSFVNTFPDARYDLIDPNESWDPVDTTLPDPPQEDSMQVVTIYGKPAGVQYTVNIVPIGNGPYQLNVLEEVSSGEKLREVYEREEFGILSVGTTLVSSIPDNARQDVTAPTPATIINLTPVSYNRINIAWTCGSDSSGIASQQIYIKQGETGHYNFLTTVSSSTTSYSALNLTPNTLYTFFIKSLDNNYNSSNSGLADARTGIQPPEPLPATSIFGLLFALLVLLALPLAGKFITHKRPS